MAVPQGSMPGLLFYNVFLCNVFFVMSDIDFANYADGNAHCLTVSTIEDNVRNSKNDSTKYFKPSISSGF